MIIRNQHNEYSYDYEMKMAKILDTANALTILKELYAIGEFTKSQYKEALMQLLTNTDYELDYRYRI